MAQALAAASKKSRNRLVAGIMHQAGCQTQSCLCDEQGVSVFNVLVIARAVIPRRRLPGLEESGLVVITPVDAYL